ncbi:MAG: phosphoenolpyruvate--protein phosphotransferase [Acidobacteria bacterium]|nr:phosphoenolpyruvate--protein phosphotransferase [Acidobacteriota bacterium]
MVFTNQESSSTKSASRDLRLPGIGASPGVAVGRALRLDESGRHQFYYVAISGGQVRREVRRLREAFAEARAQLQEIKDKLAHQLGSEHSYILDAHLMILEDDRFQTEIKQAVRRRKINAEWAVRSVTDRIIAAYKQVQDAYLRERSTDIEDIASRLLTILSGHTEFNLSELTENVIIIAEDIWPSTVAELNFNRVLGFATNSGGQTSHSAIIARALNIPAVVGIHNITQNVRTGDAVIIDGTLGEVIVKPTKPVIRDYLIKRETFVEERRPNKQATLPAETLDGVRITLRANVELPNEIESLSLFGAQGIGLYRSEFMFLNRLPDLPDEEEQVELYTRLSDATGEQGASIRVFDLGGDKLSLQGFEAEQNPALGLRGIRLSMRATAVFQTQLKAILRANRRGNLRVVLPLISTITELRLAKQFIANVKRELADSHIEHNPNLPIGVMIEVPAAAMMADIFAREANFLCIGTNDLIQYLLAVDRANENVAYLYQPLHPALLRTIAHLVRVAETVQVPLELCGEMAADPVQAIALIGLGIRALSLVPASIPLIKNAIRSIEEEQVRELMSKAMQLVSASEVEELLARELPLQAPRFFAALSAKG